MPADDDVRSWQKGFVAQSVQLEKANERTGNVLSIVTRCEALINAKRGGR